MTLRKNPPSITPTFSRAVQGTPPSAPQGHTKPAPEAKQSLDMPGPGGHAARQNVFQAALARMKARLTTMPSKEITPPSRMDSIREAFYEKAKAVSKAPEKNVGEQQPQPAKIKEKFNDLSI